LFATILIVIAAQAGIQAGRRRETEALTDKNVCPTFL
jgi:hypothetical protein